MGLSLRKRSGKILGGSRLIVEGQQMLTAKVFEPGFENKIGSLPNDHRESPTTTTTTTIPPTPTNTPTPSITPTLTPTITESQRAVTPTPTNTVSPTTTNTPTNTVSPTTTNTPTNTVTPTPTNTTTNTPTPTNTVTPTLTPIVEILIDPIITNGDEYINVGSDGYLKFVDPTPEPTVTPTNTPTLTETPIETPTNTPTTSTTPTLTETPTNTPTPTITETPTNTPTPTITETPTNTPTPTITETPTNTPTPTVTPTTVVGSLFNMVLFESGSDVIMSGTGTFNLTNLTYRQSANFNGFVYPNTTSFSSGSNLTPRPVDLYTGTTLTFPSNFGISGLTNANSGSGDMVSVYKQGSIYNLVVPSGYTSNTTLTTQSTFTGKTLTSLGVTVGTYTYSWGSGSDSGTLILEVRGTPTTPTPTPTSTVTPTVTETPTNTPTNTPTPTSSPIPVTGYGFNLVALPYNFPTSGNSIMNGAGGATSGTTDPNALATSGRGFYFNTIDSSSVDRTSYFSAFTGQSVTITLSQTGSTAIYSGDTNSFKQWIQSPMGSGFVFGTNIGVPPSGTPSGTAILIQSATTQWNYNIPVYVSVVINTPVSPTPTLTETPTNTPTPTPTITETLTNTPTPTPTITETPTNTPTPTITPTGSPIINPTPTNTPTPTITPTTIIGSLFNMYLFESGSDVILSGTGEFNTTALSLLFNGSFQGLVRSSTSVFRSGAGSTVVPSDVYNGITTYPSNFGTGAQFNANSGSGDPVGIINDGPGVYYLLVPTGYVSNTTVTAQSTFTGITLSGMNCTPGTYTYTWGSGSNSGTLVLKVGP